MDVSALGFLVILVVNANEFSGTWLGVSVSRGSTRGGERIGL